MFNLIDKIQLAATYRALGANVPEVNGVASLEDVSFDIKRKAYHNIELFDETISKMVNAYHEFEVVYRDGNAERFISDVKILKSLFQENVSAYQEKIRVFDDVDGITRMRVPVGRAYLSLFNSSIPSNKTVSDDDFWRVSDFRDLGQRIHTTPNFGALQKVLVDDKATDYLDKVVKLLTELQKSIIAISRDYETVLARMISTYENRETTPKTDKLDLTQHYCNVCGVLIQPTIPSTINRTWYGSNIKTELGNTLNDTKVLLAEPYDYITPNNADTTNGMDNLFNLIKHEDTLTLLLNMQRKVSDIVDQVSLSSKRLTRVADHIRGINESDSDGAYDTGIRDMAVLIAMYGGTLLEVLKFATTTAYNFNTSFVELHSLTSKVQNLSIEVDRYIKMRKRDVNSR